MTVPPTSPGDMPPESAPGGPGTSNPLPAWFNRRPPGGLTDETLELFIGPRWKSYQKKLAPFRADPSFVPTWNWAAAFAPSGLWFLYRKLYLAFAGFFILPGFAVLWLTGADKPLTLETMNDPEYAWLRGMYAAVYCSTVIAGGGTANWLLYRRARAAARLVEQQGLPEVESAGLLRRIGGVNRGGLAFMVAIVLMQALAALRS
jgi:hypothetical protein